MVSTITSRNCHLSWYAGGRLHAGTMVDNCRNGWHPSVLGALSRKVALLGVVPVVLGLGPRDSRVAQSESGYPRPGMLGRALETVEGIRAESATSDGHLIGGKRCKKAKRQETQPYRLSVFPMKRRNILRSSQAAPPPA